MTYRLEVAPEAYATITKLPGAIRQRVRRAIRELADDPRPPRSTRLRFPSDTVEARRIRLDHWRIIYGVVETDLRIVAVVAIRRRPPYDYDDLSELLAHWG
jgi:mRNA interferase RelE/StbE